MKDKIKIGVSGCLLGQNIRFDGQHKFHWYINEILGNYFDYVSMCPEVEIGMGIPRKTVRLVGDLKSPEMIEPVSGTNWTAKMHAYSNKKLPKLSELSGFLFKKGSPSCGVFRTKVYQKNGIPLANGRGLFADTFCKRWPLIPVEEEGRLNDAKLRENFLERVFGYHRLRQLMSGRFRRGDWVKFHERNKFLILSHCRKHYTELGQLVAKISSQNSKEFKEQYARTYMSALTVKTTAKKHSDALQHVMGFLKKTIGNKEKKDILESIENYRKGILPLIVPITLLNHYIKIHDVPYIRDQFYLNPHPFDLSLRNHV